jgi:type I restriction enzyme M protein
VADADTTSYKLPEFDAFLWRAADSLRGYVDSGDYQIYVLPLLFYKWVSDTWDLEHAAAADSYGSEVTPEIEANCHRFMVPSGCHWDDLRMSSDPGRALQAIFDRLTAANPKEFVRIFGGTDWANRQRLPDRILSDLINSLDQLTLNQSALSDKVLGAAFENMIHQFADASGKKSLGLAPSSDVIRILTQILGSQPGDTVYDPACGAGELLIGAVTELRERYKEGHALKLYGQELNSTSAAIARMNLTIHGAADFVIADGDTLRAPHFLDGSRLRQFNIIVSNPPFSSKNWGAEAWAYDPYGRAFCGVPPAGRADLAWLQHTVASMNPDNGRAGVILSHGALFRGGTERTIRRCLVESDCIDAVISLPPNLLPGTSIPVCLIVLRANRPTERHGAIVFIDASTCCTKEHFRNKIDYEHRQQILDAYRSGESEELQTRLVDHTEIAGCDWDLSVSRYLAATVDAEATENPTADVSRPVSSHDAQPMPNRLATNELSEICDVLPGRNRVSKADDRDPEFRVIRAEDIRSGLTPWSDLPPSNPRKATSVEVSPGDIIGSISGPYGRWVVVPEEYGPALASDHTVVLKGRSDVSMWFLLGFLRSPQGMELIKNTQRGAVISRITPAELKRIPIPVCPLPHDYVDLVLKGFEEEHERLARSVEDLYERLKVIYDSDIAIEVAARLDSLQGVTASMRGMTGLGEMMRIARGSYPYPVARNLHAISNTLSLRERYHEVAHEIPETLSVTLTSICAAVAREKAIRGNRASRQWIRATSRGGATIGVRNSMIFEVAGRLISEDGSEDVGGIGTALGDPSAPAVTLIRSLLTERNRIHGDYPRTDFQFQQRLMESEGDIDRLLEALSFLARWELRYAEFVEPLEDEQHSTFFSATFRVLRGDNPDWELATYRSRKPLYRGRVYAFVDDQMLIDLYPFLLVRACQVCGSQEVYHPASFSDDEVQIKSVDRGHSQTASDEALLRAVQEAFG